MLELDQNCSRGFVLTVRQLLMFLKNISTNHQRIKKCLCPHGNGKQPKEL